MRQWLGAGLAAILALGAAPAFARVAPEVIKEVTVGGPVSDVWRNWTTLEGLGTIFIPPKPPLQGKIELKPDGAYELYFLTDNPKGMQGGEGSRIIAYQEEKMLSFTWRNTPAWKIRPFSTHVVVTLEPLGPRATKVRLVQSGFGEGGEWDTAVVYFEEAWGRVLDRLVAYYEHPTDPPR
jgi:uncharacterized protein YndB with AHSA1/START domain